MSAILSFLFSKAGLGALVAAAGGIFLALLNMRGRKIRKLKGETVQLRAKERIRDREDQVEDKAEDLRDEENPEALADWANDP